MDEVWKSIDNTSDIYQVSSLGHIRKRVNIDEFILIQPHFDSYGYLYVNIRIDGTAKIKHVAIHRLVANAFVNNPYNFPIVHHIDENKTNNIYTNLFWCTYAQNNSFSQSARKNEIVKKRVIEQYDNNGLLIATYSSFIAATKAVGAKRGSNQISKCCRGVQG